MAWFLLSCAILTEIAATVALKHTNGLNIFTHTFLTISVVVLYITSYVCMAQALKLQLEVSIAYAVWSGIGTAAITIIGAIFFRESVHPVKIGGIALIVVGVAMLNLVPGADGAESVHASGLHPATNVALAGAMMGLPVTVGRHRAPVGSAPSSRYGTPYGDGYDEHRRPRHARRAWGHRPAPGIPGGQVTAGHVRPGHVRAAQFRPEHAEHVGGGSVTAEAHHVPRQRVPDHHLTGPHTSTRQVPGPYTPDHRALESAAGRHAAVTDPALHIPARDHAAVPVAAALAAPTFPAQAAAGHVDPGADHAPYPRTGLDSHQDAEIVVEPAAVEPPATLDRPGTAVSPMPPRRRAPIKGVTLLHPYPDRPAVRTTRSA